MSVRAGWRLRESPAVSGRCCIPSSVAGLRCVSAWSGCSIGWRRRFGTSGAFKPVIGILTFSCATILVALPGLIPAIQLLLDQSLSNQDRELASFIQVFWRLKHHLDPTELTAFQWIYAGGLLTLAIVAFVFINTRCRFSSAPLQAKVSSVQPKHHDPGDFCC